MTPNTDSARAIRTGRMHVSGRLQEGLEPFETRLRIEFHDEPDGRTRLEAFEKVDATLLHAQVAATEVEA